MDRELVIIIIIRRLLRTLEAFLEQRRNGFVGDEASKEE